jgi:tRNA/tmRNA/rRNA uracil-C5-methylase (TrmA/RlmC/RlmD family)
VCDRELFIWLNPYLKGGYTMIEVKELLEHLKKMDKNSNEDWMNNIEQRKKEELKFHDKDRDAAIKQNLSKDEYDQIYGNRRFYKVINSSLKYVENWITNNARGKIFLDYACGNGGNAMRAARSGAALSIGIDISRVSIENAKREAEAAGLTNCIFVQADAENTRLPEKSIDVAICSSCCII